MKKSVRIKGYNPPRESKQDAPKKYAYTEVAIEWEELDAQGKPFTQSLLVTVKGYINEPVVQAFIDSKQYTDVTYYLDTEDYNKKWYQRINGYISKDFMATVKTPLTF